MKPAEITTFFSHHWRTIVTIVNCLLVVYVFYLVFFSGQLLDTPSKLKALRPISDSAPSKVEEVGIEAIVSRINQASNYSEAIQEVEKIRELQSREEHEQLGKLIQRDSSILQQLSLVDRLNFTIAIANRLLAKPEYAQQSVMLASAELNQNNEHRLIKNVFLDIWFVASKQEVEALEVRNDLLGEKFAKYSQIRS
ncbi:MAG: hypothetical protein AAF558_12540, partial [Verrucomicrobiota bacterium]